VKNIPVDFKKNRSQIPWKSIAGTRDVLIHGYFGVDMELVGGDHQKRFARSQGTNSPDFKRTGITA